MNDSIYRRYLRNNVSDRKVRKLYYKMCDRCNYKHEDYKAYYGTEIRWKNADEFVNWFFNEQTSYRCLKDHNKKHEYQLDKDILNKGYYGPDSCVFVPKYVNSMLETRKGSRGSLPLGVSEGRNGNYSVYLSIMGKGSHTVMARTVPDIYTAFYVYKLTKEYYIKLIATEYHNRNLITDIVYTSLMNYEVKDDTGKVDHNDLYLGYAKNYLIKSKKFELIKEMVREYSVPEIEVFKDNVLEIK